MVMRTESPSGDDNNSKTPASDKQYRSTLVSLNMGGTDAEINQYIGVDMVVMRFVPRQAKIKGVIKFTHTLEGFDPDTGKIISVFVDTKLRDNGREYVKNFGGGIAEMLATKMTEEEFDEIMDTVNAENGTDFVYNFADWASVGGALKLKKKFRGVPMVIGKKFIKTETGGYRMNIFKWDDLNPEDYPHLQEDKDRYESLEGVEYDPELEGDESEESSEESDTQAEPEPAPAPAPEPVKRKPVSEPATTKRRAVERNGRGRNMFTDEEDSTDIPESVAAFIDGSYKNSVTTDKIVLGLIQDHELTERQAVDYVEAYLGRRGEKKSVAEPRRVERGNTSTSTAPKEDELVTVAKECKSKKMDVPDAFDVLNRKFPTASREEKKAAIKTAGFITIT